MTCRYFLSFLGYHFVFVYGFLFGAVPVCSVASLVSDSLQLMDCSPLGSSVHGDSPGKNTGVSCHALLQGIFPTQALNLLHCRFILYPQATWEAHAVPMSFLIREFHLSAIMTKLNRIKKYFSFLPKFQ